MTNILKYIESFSLYDGNQLFNNSVSTRIESYQHNSVSIPIYINEYWTAKQRQANSIHEISYRACFKPQLPRFFIELLTEKNDIIYDPFSGRGTTAIESALLNRNFIANDINPLSKIISKPRIDIPSLSDIKNRLNKISLKEIKKSDIDLTMFYHPETLNEILALKEYLKNNNNNNNEDSIDEWIRMVATNRLTGHSKGFFSVWTMPPNQAVSQKSQIKINIKKNQKPEYRNIKEIIFHKSKELQKDINNNLREKLKEILKKSFFLNKDASNTVEIQDETINLIVTSPPFLDIVQYADDNWLRCWFNNIDATQINKTITMSKTVEIWSNFISKVFKQLFRITVNNGYVAFEVGEIRNGKIKLDEIIVNIGIEAGFKCICIIINEQIFTKTSNIWGVDNNNKGTNTNRIVLFQKY